MWLRNVIILLPYVTFSNGRIYDFYTGQPPTQKQIDYYNQIGNLDTCTIDIKPCNRHEWRRVDGSCNSLRHPAKGTFLEPLPRVLPADYFNGSYSRIAISGNELPLPRLVRTLLLSEGKTINLDFTQSMPGFGVFMFGDIGSAHDIINFVNNTPNCCGQENRDNYMCTPNIIPKDDPVHRFSGIRCMNLTRPLTHQNLGCANASKASAFSSPKNLMKHRIISKNGGFRDLYDHRKYPVVTLEYAYIFRWFHTCQDATARMYNADGIVLKDFPMLNVTFRTGLLAKDNNMAYFTQGHFRQPCKNIDHTIDPDISERGLPEVQLSVDIPTSDLHKGRLLGLAPYIDYLGYCSGRDISSFDDLAEDMDQERIEMMKLIYEDVRDIGLLAGLWSEKLVEGGRIPRTLACLLMDHIEKAIKVDRHWFERPNRPHAFNESVPCSEIPRIDFSAWADPACYSCK